MKGFILYWGKDNEELNLMLKSAEKLSMELEVVDPRKLSVLLDPEKKSLLLEGKQIDLPDFAIAAFANDPSYRNIALLQQLETLGVLCVNRSCVMQRTKDKLLTLQLLAAGGIPVPKTMLFTTAATISVIEQEFFFPLVIKVIGGSKGDGVVLIKDKKQLESVLQIAAAGGIRENLIIQEMIASSQGRDLRVVIAGGKAVACVQRTAAATDGFKSNYSAGGSVEFYQMNSQIKDISNRIAEVMGLFIGGIDLLFTHDGFVVCEVNSIPGFYLPKAPDIWQMDIPEAILQAIKSRLLTR